MTVPHYTCGQESKTPLKEFKHLTPKWSPVPFYGEGPEPRQEGRPIHVIGHDLSAGQPPEHDVM